MRKQVIILLVIIVLTLGTEVGHAASVNAGVYHACGTTSSGTVACWGSNGWNQTFPPEGMVLAKTSAGWSHTCGLKPDGTVVCWGDNSDGRATPPAGQPVFSDFDAGYGFNCGIKTDGTVFCWGYDYYGQTESPGEIFRQISAGGNHACGITSEGTVSCWGLDGSGQAAPPAGAFSQVSAGGDHTCAIKGDGTVSCWGSNGSGQATPPGGTFSQLSAGHTHTCGMKTDGTVACWGSNDYGQATPPTGAQFISISAGLDYTCGISANEAVTCWGRNNYGQLGHVIVLDPTALPAGAQESAYAQTLTASGGSSPYRFSLQSGALPGGVALNASGLLEGTPSAAGTYTFTVQAADSYPLPFAGQTAYTLTISETTSSFKLPRTGQIKCYNAAGSEITCEGTGQDGDLQSGAPWPTPRFTNPDGTSPVGGDIVLDKVTGLAWAKDAGTPTSGSCTGGSMTWQGALDYVACLNNTNYLGHNDWRLPNINELFSLIDRSGSEAALSAGHPFINLPPYSHWSSSTQSSDASRAWHVSVLEGGVYDNAKTSTYKLYAWPVRGQCGDPGGPVDCPAKTGQTISYATGDDGALQAGIVWPNPRFTDNGDQTVSDNLTGLIWTKQANASGACNPYRATKTWQGALDYVACLNNGNYLGHNDWRLPNTNELNSLIDWSKYEPALPAGHPFVNLSDWNWSSSTYAGYASSAWFVNLWYGGVNYDDKSSNSSYAWPVRGGYTRISDALLLSVAKTGTGSGVVSATGLTCSGGSCTGNYASGTEVTLTATAGADATFVAWGGDAVSCGTASTCMVTMDGAKSVTANFNLSVEDGVCGSANGQTFVTVPTANLCSVGVASAVNGTGIWSWSCSGENGGTTVSCSASLPSAGGGGVLSLPQTGQKKCYSAAGAEIACAGTGQDGETRAGVAWPSPRFTNPDGTVPVNGATIRDRLTALEWVKDAGAPAAGACTGGPGTWPQALDYVACLNNSNYLGHNDWHLPNINELESLVNDGEASQAAWLQAQGFANVQAQSGMNDRYWSSTTYVKYGDYHAWTVDMADGNVNYDHKTMGNLHFAWPVRDGQTSPWGNAVPGRTGQTQSSHADDDGALQKGAAWPVPRFTDHVDTVTDGLTGLTWTKDAFTPGPAACGPGTAKTGSLVLDYVKCLNTHNHLGHSNWRLPNRRELRSLIDHSQYNPALPAGQPFANVQYAYWSSTTVAGSETMTQIVMMFEGWGSTFPKVSLAIPVWPVRDGQDGKAPVFDLADAIRVLQTLSGLAPVLNGIADQDGDGSIGLGEAIYILQKVAGTR